MKIVTISDSFKGTLSSKEIGQIVSEYFKEKGYDTSYIPISDGGEGFIDVIEYVTKLDVLTYEVLDPIFRPTLARYIVDDKNKTAYVEMAEASGIIKLKGTKLSTINASTYGFGMLIKHIILNHKVKNIVCGIGGSATSDMGVGMLEAMGVKFMDCDNNIITYMNNKKIPNISTIDTLDFDNLIKNISFKTLSDVINPLLGKNGAIAVFGPQKGASAEELEIMEDNFKYLYNLLNLTNNNKMVEFAGAGAAGGVGYAMKHFLKSSVISGIDAILEMVDFDHIVKDADIIITGEGKYDSQSLGGKVISGINNYHPKRLIILCGITDLEKEDVYAIVPSVATFDESMTYPKNCLIKLLNIVNKKITSFHEN